ncbi:MAG: tyrosine-type recombinase/integrase [Chitinophagales bacterium]
MYITRFLRFLEYEKRYSTHTLQSYKTDLEQLACYLKTVYDETDMTQATEAALRSWIVSLVNKKLKSKTIVRKTSSIKSFYKFLTKEKVIKINSASNLPKLKVEKRVPVFVEEKKMNILLDDVDFKKDFAGVRNRLIISLLYNLGIRRAELINLRNEDIDFYNNDVKIKGKGNKERRIPISEMLKNEIIAYQKLAKEHFVNTSVENLLLTDKGKKMYPNFVYRTVRQYLNLVTTQQKNSPHIVRHSFATALLNKGADLNVIKSLLGHSSLASTQVYTHTNIEKMKEIYQQAHPKA